MRAIAGVEAAGLQVYEVEITSAGAVKISTERVLMPVQMKPSAKVWTRHFRQRTRSRPSGSHISLGRGAIRQRHPLRLEAVRICGRQSGLVRS
jgi:hypothetical protein